ncbi:hypothetical protein CCH79_00018642 [Gambusia affinis]|uniref:Immunoglobulin V-set domain-containing protein n=1 Tax=Gambusia affinis TaxID=33528 RepID=A0A315VNK5_GAMAF|nr:hypothetical protein CCH79_00018642 [Gambusia affinis]
MWRVIPLLSVLIGALCPAAEGRPLLEVNNNLQQYQADEHSNVTLTVWGPVNSSSDSLYIDLMSMESGRWIYQDDNKDLPDLYTDDQFKGRLKCDLQLRNGRIECLLSDLRLSDSGRYEGIVVCNGRGKVTELELVVRENRTKTRNVQMYRLKMSSLQIKKNFKSHHNGEVIMVLNCVFTIIALNHKINPESESAVLQEIHLSVQLQPRTSEEWPSSPKEETRLGAGSL